MDAVLRRRLDRPGPGGAKHWPAEADLIAARAAFGCAPGPHGRPDPSILDDSVSGAVAEADGAAVTLTVYPAVDLADLADVLRWAASELNGARLGGVEEYFEPAGT